jgi:hypothetical protein
MSIKDLLKKNAKKNLPKDEKKERYRKFAYFKDAMHRNFGPTTVTGMGECKPIICSYCHERIFKGQYKDGKWRCDQCERK